MINEYGNERIVIISDTYIHTIEYIHAVMDI